MKRNLFLMSAYILGLCVVYPLYAGEMTAGLDMGGGKNPLSTFVLNRMPSDNQDELRLRLDIKEAQAITGYGAVVNFDANRYEFINAKQATNHVLDADSEQQALFLATNPTAGQVALGAVKVDGRTAMGEGQLVELTFQVTGQPNPSDFKITDGVLVDAHGKLDAVTQLEVGSFDAKPSSFGLEQNQPNPFNPSTTIAFQLPDATQVKLAIYNVLGQEVQMLVNEFRQAGRYTVVWDGKDAIGRQVASGIYVYRLVADGFVQNKRMTLVK
jgi:hypothetical protein